MRERQCKSHAYVSDCTTFVFLLCSHWFLKKDTALVLNMGPTVSYCIINYKRQSSWSMQMRQAGKFKVPVKRGRGLGTFVLFCRVFLQKLNNLWVNMVNIRINDGFKTHFGPQGTDLCSAAHKPGVRASESVTSAPPHECFVIIGLKYRGTTPLLFSFRSH